MRDSEYGVPYGLGGVGALRSGRRSTATTPRSRTCGGCAGADLARTTVYFSHYLFDVYVKYGHADRFLKRLDLWRGYVKTGLKTPLEAPGVRARSDCHAWGSHPIYHLLTGVAGIKPAANGFASVRIAPQPGGLGRISARVPTPRGMVSVALRFEGDVPSGTVTLPRISNFRSLLSLMQTARKPLDAKKLRQG